MLAALNASSKAKDQEKLVRNQEKSTEADAAETVAASDLAQALKAHDAAREDLVINRVTELKGMLHRFCELARSPRGEFADEMPLLT